VVVRIRTTNQHTVERRPAWGTAITPDGFRRLLLARASIAGLGHVAPHDLRRTTAKLLKDAVTADGAHLFDIDDIRVVLGHARIDTTQRYLDTANARVLERAAPTLDVRAPRPKPPDSGP
jgi:integrase